jgi:hypothetical protein
MCCFSLKFGARTNANPIEFLNFLKTFDLKTYITILKTAILIP